MTHAILIPKLGLTMESATIAEWRQSNGSLVTKGDILLSIETDKIVFDVEAEHTGFLQQVAAVGDELPIAGLAGYLHVEAQSSTSDASPLEQTVESLDLPTLAPVGLNKVLLPDTPLITLGTGTTAQGQRLMVSPIAKQIAQTKQLDLRSVTGSGPGGVILKRDVEAIPSQSGGTSQASLATLPKEPANILNPASTNGPTQRAPMSSMRRAIAQRMAQSLATKAQMTGFGRIDMAQAAVVREALLTAQSHLGVRISYTDMILKVCAIGLREMPEINAYIDGNDIVTWNDIHIGLAVSVEGGLLVPVIRHVDRLSLADIARARLALIAKARSGKLTRDDLDGGTFTLSNFGSYDGDFETPILNAPQSALLGIGKINDEAVVRDKQIVIRPMMSISLTFDHCLVDGSLAGRFRARIKVLLEEPALLLAALQ